MYFLKESAFLYNVFEQMKWWFTCTSNAQTYYLSFFMWQRF